MIKLVAFSMMTTASLLTLPVVAEGHMSSSRGGIEQLVEAAYAEFDAATSIVVVRFSEMTYATRRTERVFGEGEDPDLAALRVRVASNARAVAALAVEGFAPRHVVAMKATHDGTVRLYINDLDEVGGGSKIR